MEREEEEERDEDVKRLRFNQWLYLSLGMESSEEKLNLSTAKSASRGSFGLLFFTRLNLISETPDFCRCLRERRQKGRMRTSLKGKTLQVNFGRS